MHCGQQINQISTVGRKVCNKPQLMVLAILPQPIIQ